MATDPLSELQDDLNLDGTNQSLSQLKLASIDDKNWPADEDDFPKSGEYPACLGSGFWPKRVVCCAALGSYLHIQRVPAPFKNFIDTLN